ncbi:MAG: hypothetical protein AB1757_15360 [Acidobacteriota bacterium]
MKYLLKKKTPVLMILMLSCVALPISLRLAGYNLGVGTVVSSWMRITGTIGCFYNPALMSNLSLIGEQLFSPAIDRQMNENNCRPQIACNATQKKVVPFDEIADPAMPKPRPKDNEKEKGNQIADPVEKPKPQENTDEAAAVPTTRTVKVPASPLPRRSVHRRMAETVTIAKAPQVPTPVLTLPIEVKATEVMAKPDYQFVYVMSPIIKRELQKAFKQLENCNFEAIKNARVTNEIKKLKTAKVVYRVNGQSDTEKDEMQFETAFQSDEF